MSGESDGRGDRRLPGPVLDRRGAAGRPHACSSPPSSARTPGAIRRRLTARDELSAAANAASSHRQLPLPNLAWACTCSSPPIEHVAASDGAPIKHAGGGEPRARV